MYDVVGGKIMIADFIVVKVSEKDLKNCKYILSSFFSPAVL